MSKLKQSIVAQRQIPEHIRETYPVFVEFIKAYYDFLQQTQAQNLEQIRDVDTTLDEFIGRFKSELAKNFPIHLASDKAKILKHLKEFYLSRGSADSFKFLFNVLFSKDAELFYPSTQILRVSDGKWHQDVSIFVTPNDPLNKPDVKSIIGKFITITNDKGKVIHTYIENAVKYSDTIYEIFIQRDFINEINVGAKVDFDGTSYSGTILTCPTRVKVYKAGKGFKVGDIYALRTQLGRGCVIKITRVDSDGGIKNIKVIRFGLDYRTKFYSYLSNKELGAWEYVHPAQINHPYNPAEPHYNEGSGGFIDYGWASKQTYFYYDPTIPIQPELDPSHASDRYFADPAYVGEVVEQFYADDSKNPIDEDLAIIEIELGAVAKYPGYYMKADGFVSDESYIQDGDYYQAFSYVIKVEEELRRYADIVKALVHPAGMKLFSEYRIFNVLEVAAITRKITKALQLPVDGKSQSFVAPIQRGFGYNNYITELYTDQIIDQPSTMINAGYITYPSPILDLEYPGSSGIIDAKPGKTARHIGKSHNDLIELGLSKYTLNEKLLTDIITDSYTQILSSDPDYVIVRNYNELISNRPSKRLSDVISNYMETLVSSFNKNISEPLNLSETISKYVETAKTDLQLILDSYSLLVSKPVEDTISDIVDSNIREITKNFIETILYSENKNIDYVKALINSVSILEKQVNDLSKPLQDTFSNSDKYTKELAKNLSEVIENLDVIEGIYDKSLIETISTTETTPVSAEKPLTESINLSDYSYLEPIKYFIDQFDQIDVYFSKIQKLISESISLLESTSALLEKPSLAEYLNISDKLSSGLEKLYSEVVSVSEEFLLTRSVLYDDLLDLTDFYTSNFTKTLADTQVLSDDGILRTLENTKSEVINIGTTGRVLLSPYDQEFYFAVYEDYQPAIPIT